MAIRIFEMADLGYNDAPVRGPFAVSQSGTVGASSTQSSAFDGATRYITVQSDEACHVVIGANPTATTGGFKIAAGETHDFGVFPGNKVAWIQA